MGFIGGYVFGRMITSRLFWRIIAAVTILSLLARGGLIGWGIFIIVLTIRLSLLVYRRRHLEPQFAQAVYYPDPPPPYGWVPYEQQPYNLAPAQYPPLPGNPPAPGWR